jgi:hypothetical protein
MDKKINSLFGDTKFDPKERGLEINLANKENMYTNVRFIQNIVIIYIPFNTF